MNGKMLIRLEGADISVPAADEASGVVDVTRIPKISTRASARRLPYVLRGTVTLGRRSCNSFLVRDQALSLCGSVPNGGCQNRSSRPASQYSPSITCQTKCSVPATIS